MFPMTPITTLRFMQQYIVKQHQLLLAGLALMRELAGDDPVKIRKVEDWKSSVLAVVAEGLAKDGEDNDESSTH